MTEDCLAYVTAVAGTVNNSFEEKKTLKEFVSDDLKAKGDGHPWLWLLFTLCFIGSTTFYSQLYFDVAALEEPPKYFCIPKELKATNWTVDQIHELSAFSNSTQSCMALKLNYRKISKMSFGDAVDYVSNLDQFDGGMCSEIGGEMYIVSGSEASYADDFDLLCKETVSDVYAAFYRGCILGGAVFGVLGDKFGRKTSFNIAIIPFIISTFIPIYFKTATVYAWSRFVVGFCGFGIVNLLFVILVENSQRKLREIFAVIINLSVAAGMMWQYTLSFGSGHDIRANQILLAISSGVLIIFIRYLVESPKHLISKKKYESALSSLKSSKSASEFLDDDSPTVTDTNFIKSQEIVKFFFSPNYWHLTWLCMTIYAFWFFAFNFCDMKVDSQDFSSHIKMLTIYDAVGYVITAFLVVWLPRKFLHVSMVTVMGTMLILGAALPSEQLPFYQFLMTICRCIGNPAIALFCLHIAEIFPTEIRSTAIGVIGSVGYLVGYCATYIIIFFEEAEDRLSFPKFATLLGIASIFIGFLVLLLPETKKEELKDFVTQKHKNNENEKSEPIEKNAEEISTSSVLFLVATFLSFTVLLTNFSTFS